MRRLLFLLIALLVLLAGFGVAGHVLVDRSALREDVILAAKQQTGDDLRIRSLSVAFFPWPGFVARDVSLSGPQGEAAPALLTARDVRGSVALLPLLHREVRVEHLVVAHGAVTPYRSADGAANWRITPQAAASVQDTNAGAGERSPLTPMTGRWRVSVASAVLADMKLSFHDESRAQGGEAQLDRLALDGLDGRTPSFDLTARHGKTPFTLSGHVGPLAALIGEGSAARIPWAVSLAGTLGTDAAHSDRFTFDGQMLDVAALSGVSGTLRGSVAHLRDLEGIFPHAGLPEVDGVSGEISLFNVTPTAEGWRTREPGGGVNHLHLTMASAVLPEGVVLHDVALGAETLSAPLELSGRLDAAGRSIGVQLHLGTLEQAQDAWRSDFGTALPVAVEAHGLPGSAGAGDTLNATGSVGADAVALDGQAHLGVLTVAGMDLRHVVVQGAYAGPVDQGLRPALGSGTGHGTASVGEVRFGGQAYHDLKVQAVLARGRLELDPLSAQGAAGALAGAVTFAAADPGVALTARLAPVMLPAEVVQHWAGLPPLLQGPVELVGEVHGEGIDRAALLGSLTGHLGLSMVDGKVNGARLGAFVGQEAGLALGHGEIGMRCLGVHMQLAGGQAVLDTIGLEAGMLGATGHGTVELAGQALALHLLPHVGIGGTGASTPIAVTGTLDSPHVAQEAGADGRYQITIGGPTPDPCASLTAAREGLAGPAVPAPHRSKAMNLLRSLGILH
ncbi:AsmA family protein [Acidomonas methanolica]|uniref:AsmA family protein n=1 Tax=Acidomonas methanolica TaxID=437 RepID=UPI00211A1B83|nr:AsmA family protein [Acidomonas methanolica]MCQ9156154.1 AsmA family protein [Acidomonas methanolica]